MSDIIDLKTLQKLAKACRKAGITYFKQGDVEFSLSNQEVIPTKSPRVKKTKQIPQDSGQDVHDVPSDAPTEEELLFWSAAGGRPIETDEGGSA